MFTVENWKSCLRGTNLGLARYCVVPCSEFLAVVPVVMFLAQVLDAVGAVLYSQVLAFGADYSPY